MENEPISVLIVDDSALMRNLVTNIVESAEDLRVAGKAINGYFALQKIKKFNPDIITLDLEMPEMGGIELLKVLKENNNDIPVLILSSVAKRGAQITMEALSLGASDFITKPHGSMSIEINAIQNDLIEKIRAYGSQYKRSKGKKLPPKPIKKPPEVEIKKPEPVSRISKINKEVRLKRTFEKVTPLREPGSVDIIAIGISTGGPNALRELLSQIDKNLPIPILIVQHMPAGFTEEFAKSLDKICPLKVKEAKNGDIINSGRVYIAPGDSHLKIVRKPIASIVKLTDDPPVNGHRPSVDVLFESVSKYYSGKILGVIMTGMGKDGAHQIGRIYKDGGHTIAQNENTCVVYGMPKVAVDNGYIRHIVPLHEIANYINKISRGEKIN